MPVVAELSDPFLRAAVQRVAASLASEEGEAAAAQLLALARAVEGSALTPELEDPSLSETVVLQQLLAHLYAQVLREWSEAAEPPPSDEMLPVLRAFERVRTALPFQADESYSALTTAARGPELIAELVHDLTSPLTSILFLSETIRSGQSGQVTELQNRQLGIIYGAALSLVSMAGDVLELVRGGQRLFEKEPTELSISAMLDSICDLLRPLAEEKGLSIRTLPPPIDRRLGYPVPLSRVLLNLATNALKFTEEGLVEIVVRPTGLTTLEFSVRDTGPGLDEHARKHLFQPFRWSSSSGRYGFSGSGLGLSICRKLVRAMGSELHYETEQEWGTRFHFDLSLPPAYLG